MYIPEFDINEQGIKEMASDQSPKPALNSAIPTTTFSDLGWKSPSPSWKHL